MDFIYEEKKSSPVMIGAFVVGIIAFVIGAYVYWQSATYSTDDTIAMIIVAIVIIGLLKIFNVLSISLTTEKLRFGFGPFKKTIRKGEIRQIEKKDFKFGNYLGYGIRMGFDKSWGYVVGGDTCLMITLEKKKFYFNTDKPDELMTLIKQYLM